MAIKPIGALVELISTKYDLWLLSNNLKKKVQHGADLVFLNLDLLEFESVENEDWNKRAEQIKKLMHLLDPALHSYQMDLLSLSTLQGELISETTMELYRLEYFTKEQLEERIKGKIDGPFGSTEMFFRVPPPKEKDFDKAETVEE